MIYLDDLAPPDDKKEKRHTVVMSESDDKLLRELKDILGSKNVAEIMRRSIRLGIVNALDKFKPKAS
jgi:hypothetical protein